MKKIILFHFESCPFCRFARRWVREALDENPALQTVEIEMIDEQRNPAVANRYDYWYVPCFYVDGKKVHEGACTKRKVVKILESAAE